MLAWFSPHMNETVLLKSEGSHNLNSRKRLASNLTSAYKQCGFSNTKKISPTLSKRMKNDIENINWYFYLVMKNVQFQKNIVVKLSNTFELFR